MAQKQIRWTSRALYDKFDILEYWINRNKSTTFSEKLDQLFDKALNRLTYFPEHGKKLVIKIYESKLSEAI